MFLFYIIYILVRVYNNIIIIKQCETFQTTAYFLFLLVRDKQQWCCINGHEHDDTMCMYVCVHVFETH